MSEEPFSQLPHYFFDLGLTPIQFSVLVIINRKTNGWGKSKDRISISQFSEMIKMSKPTFIKAKNDLIKMKILKESKLFKNDIPEYEIISKSSKDILPLSSKDILLVVKNNDQSSKESLPTKETTKEKDSDSKNRGVNPKGKKKKTNPLFKPVTEFLYETYKNQINEKPNWKGKAYGDATNKIIDLSDNDFEKIKRKVKGYMNKFKGRHCTPTGLLEKWSEITVTGK